MKHVVSLSFTSSAFNFDTRVEFRGQEVRVSHYGCDFNLELFKDLVKRFDGVADAIAISGIHPPVKIGGRFYDHKKSQEVLSIARLSTVLTGHLFRSVYIPWVLKDFVHKNPAVFRQKRIAFYSGILDHSFVDILSESSDRLSCLDPYLHMGVTRELRGLSQLETYTKFVVPFLRRRPLDVRIRDPLDKPRIRGVGLREFERADIFVSRLTLLERFSLDHLHGKIVVLDALTPGMARDLEEHGVKNVIHFMPQVPGIWDKQPFNFAVLEAMLAVTKKSSEPLDEDDILNWIASSEIHPQAQSIQIEKKKSRKFAFIIHPLSYSDLFRHPLLRPLGPVVKPLENVMEKAMTKIPGVLYGTISGIQSESTGETTEGLIYTIFDTPKQLMKMNPEVVYDKLVRVCEQASSAGADIIGLGAYTKVAGDSGITVARRSPIPVTTGNSLSASATLWAARHACEKLGFLPAFKTGMKVRGKAMVIGATGSIGAVTAKLLAGVFEELVLCSRTAHKLLELKQDIDQMDTGCRVTVVTNPSVHARNCDLIVTSTSAVDKKVLDIMSVKPGCVICDVSRPLDIRAEDAVRRPDVLVIESGEIELPGTIKLSCDIGTPDTVVYACLAETALLALEGRMESFTLSRNISFNKVLEIYDIARKHGARLAAIRGHSGLITDREISLCREHAEKNLKNWSFDVIDGHQGE